VAASCAGAAAERGRAHLSACPQKHAVDALRGLLLCARRQVVEEPAALVARLLRPLDSLSLVARVRLVVKVVLAKVDVVALALVVLDEVLLASLGDVIRVRRLVHLVVDVILHLQLRGDGGREA